VVVVFPSQEPADATALKDKCAKSMSEGTNCAAKRVAAAEELSPGTGLL
jgi:hypothetical protein